MTQTLSSPANAAPEEMATLGRRIFTLYNDCGGFTPQPDRRLTAQLRQAARQWLRRADTLDGAPLAEALTWYDPLSRIAFNTPADTAYIDRRYQHLLQLLAHGAPIDPTRIIPWALDRIAANPNSLPPETFAWCIAQLTRWHREAAVDPTLPSYPAPTASRIHSLLASLPSASLSPSLSR